MQRIELYVGLLGTSSIIGYLFSKSPVPISMLQVIAGMLISIIPGFPEINLQPELVLDVFLPLLIYGASSESSWRDVKTNLNPIVSLSIGHVIFITVLVAITIHYLLPPLGWPLAFVLGAVISPPDAVAILSIAEKIRVPQKIMTILKGESMLNDATALIFFRFSLAAVLTHEFSPLKAFTAFFIVVICETVYGLILGNILGKIRLKIHDPTLQMMISILTPFLAYLPAERLGGCGVVATVVTGLVIGHKYLERFPPEVRLSARAVWETLSFAIQSILFLLVGLNLRFIIARISKMQLESLSYYSIIIITVVIIGRFLWVYASIYFPAFLLSRKHKKLSAPPWQYPFVVSWAGMRGGISLAAALAVPALPKTIDNVSSNDLIIFLVFCVITATLLIQGITLPLILRLLGIENHGENEKQEEHINELHARETITNDVIQWLFEYKNQVSTDEELVGEIKFRIKEYKKLKESLLRIIDQTEQTTSEAKLDSVNEVNLFVQIIEIERASLQKLWDEEKIKHHLRNKLLHELDHRSKQYTKSL